MPDPIAFVSQTPRFGLPFLFAGQSQKEFSVNEAHALTDMLLHPVIEGVSDTPPATPDEGECWLLGTAPTGAWAGYSEKLAGFIAGNWTFATPREGLRLYDRATGQAIFFVNGWQRATAPAIPAGGAAPDPEARQAIGALIEALRNVGIFAAS